MVSIRDLLTKISTSSDMPVVTSEAQYPVSTADLLDEVLSGGSSGGLIEIY